MQTCLPLMLGAIWSAVICSTAAPPPPTATAPLAPPHGGDQWLLVRGEGSGVSTLSWQSMGEAYLGSFSWRAVSAEESDSAPASRRLRAGSPDTNPALAALLPALGVSVTEGALTLGSRRVAQGTGLVLVADDPDGQGLLVLFTGVDELSAYQGFTTNIDIQRRGATLVRQGRVLSAVETLQFDNHSIEVVPLEILWWTAGAWHPERSLGDRALAVSRALEGYRFVYEAATVPDIDLLAFCAELLSGAQSSVDAAIALGFHHDMIVSAREREQRLDELLGPRTGPAPVVFTLVGHPQGTNARSFGNDPDSGRPALLLNLSAFAGESALDAALVHELVHTRHALQAHRLVDLAIREGVAALITQQLEGVSDAQALMWSDDKLETARARQDELLAAFREIADSTDATVQGPWMTLHQAPERPFGVPDRCAYYLGFSACRAWLDQDASRTAADLLTAAPDEVLAALP